MPLIQHFLQGLILLDSSLDVTVQSLNKLVKQILGLCPFYKVTRFRGKVNSQRSDVREMVRWGIEPRACMHFTGRACPALLAHSNATNHAPPRGRATPANTLGRAANFGLDTQMFFQIPLLSTVFLYLLQPPLELELEN